MINNLIAISFCIAIATSSHQSFVIDQSAADESVVLGEILTNYFIKYFNDDQIFISIILPPSNKAKNHFLSDFFVELFDDPVLAEFAYSTLDRLDDSIRDHRRSFNLILTDDWDSLPNIAIELIAFKYMIQIDRNVLNVSTIKDFHLSQEFMIVVNENISNTTEALADIFGLLWTNGLVNSHVLTMDSGAWTLFTFMPYQMDCYTLTQIKMATFTQFNSTDNITLSFNELYPPKLKNFFHCPLYYAPSFVAPFDILRNVDGHEHVEGIDISIIEEIARLLKLSVVYRYVKVGTGHGLVFDNGTASGNLGLVLKGEANVTSGGYMITTERLKLLLPSDPYLQSSVGFAYKLSDSSIFSISRLLAPFEYRIWILLLVIFVLSILIILMTKKLSTKWRHFFIGGRVNRSPILNMYDTMLGRPIHNQYIISGRHFGNFARTLFMFWILLWFVIRSLYEGSLYTNLQSNRLTSACDSFEKIRTHDCKVFTGSTTSSFIGSLIEKQQIHTNNYELMTSLKELYDTDEDGVVLTNHLSWKYFNLVNSPHRRLGFTNERLFMYTPVFYFHKKSIFKDIFNEQLQRLRETGLTQYWIKKYIDDRILKPRQREPKKLQIKSIFAAFEICIVMYVISIIVFILELLSTRYRRIQIFLDFLTY